MYIKFTFQLSLPDSTTSPTDLEKRANQATFPGENEHWDHPAKKQRPTRAAEGETTRFIGATLWQRLDMKSKKWNFLKDQFLLESGHRYAHRFQTAISKPMPASRPRKIFPQVAQEIHPQWRTPRISGIDCEEWLLSTLEQLAHCRKRHILESFSYNEIHYSCHYHLI